MFNRLLILALLLLLFGSCSQQENHLNVTFKNSDSLYFFCDLEQKPSSNNDLFSTSNPNINVVGGRLQSKDIALSGTHSIRLDSKNQYGLNFALKNLKGGEFVTVSVWQYDKSTEGAIEIKLKDEEQKAFYRTYFTEAKEVKGAWRKHSISFVVDKDISTVEAHVYSGNMITYFDDLSVVIYPNLPVNTINQTLHINLNTKEISEMNELISKTFYTSIIPPEAKKYVSAKLIPNDANSEIAIKLKGDWKDHLHSGKTSFRIKVKGDTAIMGMKNFSLMHPKTRNYIDEWLIHQIAEGEGILTTSYDFTNLYINEINHGIYAIEEHFDKSVVERRSRREGPILKFDETPYWSAIQSTENSDLLPYFQASQIDVFKKNRTYKSPQLNQSFIDGQNLLALFKSGTTEIQKLFDIDQLARFYALMELAGSEHGLRWHNRRFYFNPVTQKLEHIAYDINPFIEGHSSHFEKTLGMDQSKVEAIFDVGIFYDTAFQNRLFYHLNRMTEKSYLDSVFQVHIKSLEEFNNAMLQEKMYSNFGTSKFYDQAEMIQHLIPELKQKWTSKVAERTNPSDWFENENYQPINDTFYHSDFGLKAYPSTDDGPTLVFENYHAFPITIHGFKLKGESDFMRLESQITVPAFTSKPGVYTLNSGIIPHKVYYTCSNRPKKIAISKVSKWPKPVGGSTRMALETRFNPHHPAFTIIGEELQIKAQTVIDELIYIPAKYKVKILPGTVLKFEGEGGLIINNTFEAIGTSDKPIVISAVNDSCNGLTILNAEKATISFVQCTGLSNLNYGNWELTGGITIYETQTFIRNCQISRNSCEDALNIIRSVVDIDGLVLEDTPFDGLDMDFCTGKIKNSYFNRTNNDGIDLSGSTIKISEVFINDSGDKGISGGEGSDLQINDISIKNVATGIASKDGSRISGSGISIKNAEVGFAAYRKKKEYPLARIQLTDCQIKNTGQKYLVDLGSVIEINSEKIVGDERIEIDSLYSRFEK